MKISKSNQSVCLTAKGADAHEGKFIIGRWAATREDKTVYVYASTRREASEAAEAFFLAPVFITPAGHIDWSILDAGTPKERAVKRLFMNEEHDAILVVDNQYEFAKKSKGAS